MPFTLDEFLDVFRRYNEAIWPGQIVLVALGLSLAALALARPERQRLVAAVLAFLWAWSGAVYHLGFFAAINPVARLFGAAFLLQAILWSAWMQSGPTFRLSRDVRSAVAAALLSYALVVYPTLNAFLGHPYPTMPTFGAPCPTTIASFAVLAAAQTRPPWWLWVVPVLWACVGTAAALMLGVREDLGLPIAACAAIGVQVLPAARAPSRDTARPSS